MDPMGHQQLLRSSPQKHFVDLADCQQGIIWNVASDCLADCRCVSGHCSSPPPLSDSKVIPWTLESSGGALRRDCPRHTADSSDESVRSVRR